MRCSCRECGVYMVQAEDGVLGCICPECLNRCTDCLGTNTVISRAELLNIKKDPTVAMLYIKAMTENDA